MAKQNNKGSSDELNMAQIERIDEIDNAVYDLCVVLTENNNLEWNMEYIEEIADIVCDILVSQGYLICYPAIVHDSDGSSYIADYHEGQSHDK